MPDAFVLSTAHFTAGILSGRKKSLCFQSSHSTTRSLQNRTFATPEAARRAVEKLFLNKESAPQVACRPLW
jgi:hypothetical protein